MKISYGKGIYTRFEGREGTTYKGEIVLDDVKIYIDGKPDSSISLDLIREIKKTKEGIEMEIVPTYPLAYKIFISGEGVKRLLSDLLIFKRFKKVWRNKWKAMDFKGEVPKYL